MPEREPERLPEAPEATPPPPARCQTCGAPQEAAESILCGVCGEPVLLWGWA